MKEKLTLEHIAPYLPYGLKAEFMSKRFSNRIIQELNCENAYKLRLNSVDVKPILRPCDLTKPIQVDGKEVIPIVELAKIALPNPSEEAFGGMSWFEYEGEAVLYVNGCFILEGHDYSAYCPNQLALFKWLYANKFDVDGLIDAGLAIDINTLETNPYE